MKFLPLKIIPLRPKSLCTFVPRDVMALDERKVTLHLHNTTAYPQT